MNDSVAVILCRQDPQSTGTGVVNAEREAAQMVQHSCQVEDAPVPDRPVLAGQTIE
ncbi:hypothetical protein ABZ468_30085 [Streptomyces sp. NPDC005708]|uniref:hypothetical protein n=1 Tax=Streptomyces sp. NPDC005708 TaxID=3154564 RepID=UPI0033F42508